MKAKSIHILLPTGNPKEVRKAEIKTRAIEVTQYSRKYLRENNSILEGRGIYILFDKINKEIPEIYIGKGIVKNRLANHKSKAIGKDFWNYAVTVHLKTENGFNANQIAYLEYYLINKAKELKNSVLNENKQIPENPNLDEGDICDLHDYIDNIELLFSTLGLKVFEEIEDKTEQRHVFSCKDTFGSFAEGVYTDDGFLVFKGAKVKKETAPSLKNSKQRIEFLYSEKLEEYDDKFYTLLEDHLFTSVTSSVEAVLGSPRNGWINWKDEKGKTLDEVYRK
ncbi:MAG: GIY-YIG nuclease family protein [Proteobacteria bacterium]|nr:GIY-YIG nuclease family protein [Pseudomonadota bacterium]